MKPRKTPRLALAAALAAGALAAPSAADAAKYVGKASGVKITFNQKGKRISKVRTAIFNSCFRNPGPGTKGGIELFRPKGKFKLGKKTLRKGSAYSAIYGGKLGFNYTVIPKRKSRRVIAGRLRLSFFWSELDPFTNQIYFWNCSGATKFKAHRK